MASLPSGSVAINAQFFRAPDGIIWQYFNSTLQFNKLYTASQILDLITTINRKPIPILSEGQKIIDWDTDLVPDDELTRTYFERFGNIIQGINGLIDNGNGTFSNYSPSDYTITYSGENIASVTINDLYVGFISIL